jgi:predicted transcriptional regulator
MKVADILVKDVVKADENEKVIKVFARMEERRIHQLPIVSKDIVTGQVVLKNLLRKAYDPTKSIVKHFMVAVPFLNSEMDLEEATKILINSGMRALPVVDDDSLIGMLSEADVIKHVTTEEEISPELVMNKAIIIGEKDNIEKATSLMYRHGIDRLPVINWEDKLIGCIDSLSMIKFYSIPKESPRFSKFSSAEKESLRGFLVKDYMRKTFGLEKKNFSLEKVIDALQSNEEVIITEKGMPVGVITPKDVLELSLLIHTHPSLTVSHLTGVDSFEKTKLQDLLFNFMDRFEKSFKIQRFFVYADTYKKKEKGREKFSLRSRLITNKKLYVAKSFGWSLTEAARELLDSLEKQLVRDHERHLGKVKSKRRAV